VLSLYLLSGLESSSIQEPSLISFQLTKVDVCMHSGSGRLPRVPYRCQPITSCQLSGHITLTTLEASRVPSRIATISLSILQPSQTPTSDVYC
jgi:hypothetical protein